MDELAKRFAELSERLGPYVVDAARGATRMEAVSCIVSGAMCLGVSGALAFLAMKLWKAGWNREEATLLPFALWLIAFVFGLTGLWHIIDPWTWTALANPDLWLAKKVLKI